MASPNPSLTRYGSAPGSFLAVLADSVVPSGGGTSANGVGSLIGSGSEPETAATLPISCFFTSGGRGGDNLASCLSSESACCGPSEHHVGPTEGGGAQLMRHSSSPAGFFAHLMMDNGFSVSRGMGHYSQAPNNGVHTMPSTRLKSQLSFSRQEPLSQISEISIPEMGENTMGGNSSDENAGNVGQSYISSNYSIGSWDDTNSIAFSTPSRKRRKDSSDNLLASLGCLESQYSLPTTSLEMAAIDKLLQAQDSVAFKVRAKRGCATHPRSIAERERRTRISEKLRKLQELVPNMDRQTSTSDMLVLAVQHIKELQKQAQVRREKISERMKYLQDLVPGCNNITGKASMLDEIINYVQSLHEQVELLSMKLAYVDPLIDCNKQSFMEKETGSLLMELDKETGHQKRITLLSKSADGSYFLTSSLNKSAKCSGECMRIIFPSKEKVAPHSCFVCYVLVIMMYRANII